MQTREKLLAIGLGSVLVLWGGIGFYDTNIVAPLKDKEDQLARAHQEYGKSKDDWKRLNRMQKLVRDSVEDSLPPDGQDAQRVYLKWVQELAELSHWKEIAPNKTLDARTQLGKIGLRIPVTLTAKARISDVATFMWHFERTDLLQRVASLHLTSPTPDGNPELTVVVTLEGVSLSTAKPRKRLFPTTELTAAIDAKANQVQVSQTEDFPTTVPFRVRIGNEFATVTAIEGQKWTLQRGIDTTTALAHVANSIIEYAPIRPLTPEREAGISSYKQLLEKSGFVKPTPLVEYKPKLATAKLPILTRGDPWTAELKIEGWNPRWPAPVYELPEAPAGLKVGPSGKLEWDVPATTAAGNYKVKVVAKAGDTSPVQSEIEIVLREKNRPPKFDPMAKVQAYVNRPFTIPVVAKDEDPDTKLTFALGGTIPAGMTIDANSGKIDWTPAETLDPAPIAFQVTATDNGTPPLASTLEISGQLDDDHAGFTRLTGVVNKGDERVAMLTDLLANMSTYVGVGDTIKASEMEIAIDSIESDGIVIRSGATRMKLELGENLRQAKPLPAAPVTPPPPPAAVLLPGK
ncbi:MAG: Ig domain-containing protein [Planctomycetaceae bacterium]